MLTLCICDDSPEDTTQIRALADRFVQEHPELGLRTEFFSSPFDLLEHLDEKGGFDLYLLDILMPHMKGIELAQRIRERGEPAEAHGKRRGSPGHQGAGFCHRAGRGDQLSCGRHPHPAPGAAGCPPRLGRAVPVRRRAPGVSSIHEKIFSIL